MVLARDRFHRLPGLRCVLVLLLILLPEAAARAQEEADPSRHSLRSGAWALDFGVQPSFSGFSGSAGIAVKHHLSDRLGLRLGGTTVIEERESDGSRRELFPGYPEVEYDRRTDYDVREYTAFLHLQPYVSVQERTAIYLYGGPIATWTRSSDSEWEILTNGSAIRYRREYEAWYAGLEVGAGFEWFWTRRVSLGAYYGISGMYGEFDREEFYRSSQYAPPAEVDYLDSGRVFSVRTRGSFFKVAAYF
ncbi:MAG TPA: hypothetical protein VFP58_11525 [Candidatus Eisenbacteria bacterium]|nr:hypothetical protein [Candidatus Eisenbacteria bacterium]